MSFSKKSALLTAIRVLLVGGGGGIAAFILYKLATMPPPSPQGDGFAQGMAVIFGGTIAILALGVAAIGVILPALTGLTDPLGFNRWQRLALKGAGVLIGSGIVLTLVAGFVHQLIPGLLLCLGLVLSAVFLVCVTLVWRLAELAVRGLSRIDGKTRRNLR